jgi:peroxiredoxin
MQKKYVYFLISALAATISACIVTPPSFKALAPGLWRGTLQLQPKDQLAAVDAKGKLRDNIKFEEVTQGELPFMFEVKYDANQKMSLDIINADERITLEDMKYGTDRRTGKDTIFINFPVYDSYIRGTFEERVFAGDWVVRTKENYKVPFVARYGQNWRFTDLKKEPTANISGKWQTVFQAEGEQPEKAVGEFKQDGNHLTGTFLTETGDHRFLEGTVQANKFYLSCFDGAHAFLYEGKITDNTHLIGSFWSGKHYKATWEAVRNPDAKLGNADTLTQVKKGMEKIDFKFEDSDGKVVSLNDEKFKGKSKIIQLFGTWCPNCYDETRFLVNFLKENHPTNVAVIGLGFEKYKEKEKSLNSLKNYKTKMNVPYDLLLAGYADKNEAAKVIPNLNRFMAFPTTLFLNKNNQITRIHTGFSGPATSEYTAFKADFEKYIQEISN